MVHFWVRVESCKIGIFECKLESMITLTVHL